MGKLPQRGTCIRSCQPTPLPGELGEGKPRKPDKSSQGGPLPSAHRWRWDPQPGHGPGQPPRCLADAEWGGLRAGRGAQCHLMGLM